ncbi:hypothetical protein [Streptomyces sp. B6B3]|uniref:hypothetical protein n=1 Tax=Streptomyces sp. B6B3 TaxID=3153570 RepID=UPI00325E62B2
MTSATLTDYRGLSCYTANLTAYLDAEFDAGELVFRSVRTAVRTDLVPGRLAFSHHRVRLERLPDGSRLRHRAARTAADALDAVADQVRRYGRALVVVDNRRLPWSPAVRTAPHWLLVDGPCGAAGWPVRDEFSGLLPAGEQLPFAGRLTSRQLADAMDAPEWNEQQRVRNRLACGFPLAVPDAPGRWWLERTTEPAGAAEPLPGRWLTDELPALAFLGDRLADSAEALARHLDDCWALAGHHCFALRHALAGAAAGEPARTDLETAEARWAALPRMLRMAAESAERGRPRPGIVRRAFAEVGAAQHAAQRAVPDPVPAPIPVPRSTTPQPSTGDQP